MLRNTVGLFVLLSGLALAEDAEPHVLWHVRVNGVHQGCAAVQDGQLFAPVLGGNSVVSMDAATGQVKWTRSLADTSPYPPIVDQDSVYVITGSCTLYKLSRKDGKTQWSRWLSGSIQSMPTLADGRVYAAACETPNHAARRGGWNLVCLDAAKGKELWATPIGSDIKGAPLVTGTTVYVATRDGVLRALDTAKGKELWTRQAGAESMPVPCRDWLVYWSRDGLVARSREDGIEAWTWSPEGPSDPDAQARGDANPYGFRLPMVTDTRAYVASSANKLACVELKDRKVAWTWSGGDEVPGGPVMVGGKVYFGTSKGTVVSLSAQTGQTLWALKTDAQISDAPTIMDGRIYFHDLAGAVVAVDAASPDATGWGMWGGSPSHTGAVKSSQPAPVVTPSAGDSGR